MNFVKKVVRTLVLSALALVAILNAHTPQNDNKADLKLETNTITAMNDVVVETSPN